MDSETERRLLIQVANHEKELAYHLQKLDALDTEQSCWELWREFFITPAILLLAGHGFRPQLREMLATMETEMVQLEQMPALQRQLLELRAWRRAVDKIPPWTGVERESPWSDPE